MLQDAGGLLDEASPGLRGCLQDLVQLALADDDVHFASHAGIAEQLLHVEQSDRLTVDRILGATATEQHPADGDLGELERKRRVGVVDGQRDLGAAQWCPPGGAGEDDVLHLSAA